MNTTLTSRRRPAQNMKGLHQQATQFRLDELQLFNTVAQQGSFSTAAKVLGITQSTASKRIRKLEESLDLRLFDRTTRHVVLTELGSQFLGYSQRILDGFDEAINFVKQSRSEPVGELKIGVPQWILMSEATNHFFAQFRRKYPDIRFSFVSLATAENQLETAEVDLMIQFAPAGDRKMVRVPLWQIELDFYVGKQYLKRCPAMDHPAQLAKLDCLLIRNYLLPDREWLWTNENDEKHSITVNPTARFDHVEQALEWALQDLGVVWCPVALAEAKDPDRRLVRLFDGKYASKITISLMYPSRQVRSPLVDLFVKECLAHLTSHVPQAGETVVAITPSEGK